MVVNPTNVYKPSCHPLLLNKPNTLKQLTGCLQAGVYKLTWWAFQEWLYQLGDANVTKIAWHITINIHRPQIPKCFPMFQGKAHHQMYPKYPWKTIMVFFQHSASLGNNIGLFKPKERHTSLHRWPYRKHSWQGLDVSREIFWTNLLKWYIVSNHYIYTNHHISYAFGIMSLQRHISNYISYISVISLYPICMV